MSDTPKTHKAVIVRDFNDATTGESFTADDTVTIEHGAFLNYEHAGLVRKPNAADARADDAKAKPAA
jgi:hypothetical protein